MISIVSLLSSLLFFVILFFVFYKSLVAFVYAIMKVIDNINKH